MHEVLEATNVSKQVQHPKTFPLADDLVAGHAQVELHDNLILDDALVEEISVPHLFRFIILINKLLKAQLASVGTLEVAFVVFLISNAPNNLFDSCDGSVPKIERLQVGVF